MLCVGCGTGEDCEYDRRQVLIYDMIYVYFFIFPGIWHDNHIFGVIWFFTPVSMLTYSFFRSFSLLSNTAFISSPFICLDASTYCWRLIRYIELNASNFFFFSYVFQFSLHIPCSVSCNMKKTLCIFWSDSKDMIVLPNTRICSVLKPEHFSRGLQSCLQKNGWSPIQLYGDSLMLEWVSL